MNPRTALTKALLGTATALFLVFPSCQKEVDGAACPCLEGWTCCTVDSVCRRSCADASGPSASLGGDAGTALSPDGVLVAAGGAAEPSAAEAGAGGAGAGGKHEAAD